MTEIDQSFQNQDSFNVEEQDALSVEEQERYINTVKNAANLVLGRGTQEWVGKIANPELDLNGKYQDYFGFLRCWIGKDGRTKYFAYEKSPLAEHSEDRMMGSLEGRHDNRVLFILALNSETNTINTYEET
ncbi:MAG TPA: hypothetical protein VLF89_02520 [Candidatus Saccharimonadales bacterium]|nr:hypothetical protein [Candidatus Saccharimonadales bacterium]